MNALVENLVTRFHPIDGLHRSARFDILRKAWIVIEAIRMGIETLGEAWNLSWVIHIRCLDDGREGMKHRRSCDYRKYLDLETLVCTRGGTFRWLTSRSGCAVRGAGAGVSV